MPCWINGQGASDQHRVLIRLRSGSRRLQRQPVEGGTFAYLLAYGIWKRTELPQLPFGQGGFVDLDLSHGTVLSMAARIGTTYTGIRCPALAALRAE
ncbi:MAG: hypothetical protein OXO52_08630 [Rhodospirillales bacterium]|nr:hypothetical protein [Rhodospirillales bacterium]MDE0378362.1 hypothetical protein [Rhodospirillales bacterium]